MGRIPGWLTGKSRVGKFWRIFGALVVVAIILAIEPFPQTTPRTVSTYTPPVRESPSQSAAKPTPESPKIKEAQDSPPAWEPPEGYTFRLADRGILADPVPVGWRWLQPGEFECRSGTCWAIEVIPSRRCGFLYGKVVFLDKDNRNIDFSNDSLSDVKPGQKAVLVFRTFEETVETLYLEEINCRQD